MKTAVFGGSFDPVHPAHIGIGRHLLSAGLAEKVLYLPAARPPHKEEHAVTPYRHRRAMLERVMEPGMEISDLEREREGKSYTIDTLKILTERFPGDSFAWIIGSDSLRQLHTWHRAEELVRTYSFLTYPRGDAVRKEELLAHWDAPLAEKLLSGILPCGELFPVSSTEIRRLLRTRGPDAVKDLLHPAVLEYIRINNLYREDAHERTTAG